MTALLVSTIVLLQYLAVLCFLFFFPSPASREMSGAAPLSARGAILARRIGRASCSPPEEATNIRLLHLFLIVLLLVLDAAADLLQLCLVDLHEALLRRGDDHGVHALDGEVLGEHPLEGLDRELQPVVERHVFPVLLLEDLLDLGLAFADGRGLVLEVDSRGVGLEQFWSPAVDARDEDG